MSRFGQDHRAMKGKFRGGCRVCMRACSHTLSNSGVTCSDMDTACQGQKARFSAQYLRASSADTSFSSTTCLYFLNLVCSRAMVHFSVLPRKYNTDSLKNCEKGGCPGWIPSARNTPFNSAHECQEALCVPHEARGAPPTIGQRKRHDNLIIMMQNFSADGSVAVGNAL